METPIADHLRDSTPSLEKCKVVQCRKLEIKKDYNFSVILFLKLEKL